LRRDFAKLHDRSFDLVVIGGGIFGAWAAYDAALRGLSVALVEKDDWGAGTSSASSKLIHGGLRYLEHFWLGLVRKSLAERRRLLRLAPHRIYPLRFLFPIYKGGPNSRLAIGAGLWLYDCLAGRDEPVGLHQPLSRNTLLEKWPFLQGEGLKGGFSYGDCGTDDARLTLEIVCGALEAGATAVNHAKAVRFLESDSRITGVAVEDTQTGETAQVQANFVLNAAGPWAEDFPGMTDKTKRFTRMTKGIHLVMPPLPAREAMILTAKQDGRFFFLIPWYNATLIGTTDTDFNEDPDTACVLPEDAAYLLEAANNALKDINWTTSDIRGAFAGVRTLRNIPGKRPSDVTRKWSLEMTRENTAMPVGGKLTSARQEAACAIDHILKYLKHDPAPCPTKDRPFPWHPGKDFSSWKETAIAHGKTLGLDQETAQCLMLRYGASVKKVHNLLNEKPHLAKRITPSLPFALVEVLHAVEHEMAVTLEDILRQRIPLAILAQPEQKEIAEAAELAGEYLGWPEERRKQEIEAFMEKYALRTLK